MTSEPQSEPDHLTPTDACVLMACLIAARKLKDRLLEHVMRRDLRDRHQVSVTFHRDREGQPCSK